MKRITKTTPIDQVAAFVCEALKKQGVDAVLVGGAVVSIYTRNEYESYDLDFVLPGLAKNVDDAMEGLGFSKDASRHWIHPHNPYFVEFPGSILALGDSTEVELKTLKTPAGMLKLLSPTSSVMDRLAAYYHWKDRQGLDQAVMIASRHPVSLSKIEKWSRDERQMEKFRDFKTDLKALKSRGR